MGLWETVISVVGTLGGVIIGYLLNHRIESERRKHERETEYRLELRKHVDSIIKPMFVLIQNLWGSLAVLDRSIELKKSVIEGKTLNHLLIETQKANSELQIFIGEKYNEISFLFPSPFPWIFAPLDELIKVKILKPILEGKEPTEDITTAVNTCMTIQKDLRRIIGFEVEVETETTYPFK